ncbi:hypothetical protein IW262DRAFT_1494956 [Armillaria fumosa]|nr:hypothetical protein IW262DRAFT_1494956 [Armillaria fumosa]
MAYTSEISVISDSTLLDLHSMVSATSPRSSQRRFLVFKIFRIRFGDSVFPGIVQWHPDLQQYAPGVSEPNPFLCDLELDLSSLVKKKGIRLPWITNDLLKSINDSLHFTQGLQWRKFSRDDSIDFLVDSLQKRWDDGISLPAYVVADMLNHYVASVDLGSQTALFNLLEMEYGLQLCSILLPLMHTRSHWERRQNMTAERHDIEAGTLAAHFCHIKDNWPLPVPQDVKDSCVCMFREKTCWPETFPCAVCSRELCKGEPLPVKCYSFAEVDESFKKKLHLELLAVNSAEHHPEPVGHPMLYDCMLEPSGCIDELFNICVPCETVLKDGRLPKYALRNQLFRGALPVYFNDMMWVEEMVCSVY